MARRAVVLEHDPIGSAVLLPAVVRKYSINQYVAMRCMRGRTRLDVETIPSFASKYRRTHPTDAFDWVSFPSGAKAFSRPVSGRFAAGAPANAQLGIDVVQGSAQSFF